MCVVPGCGNKHVDDCNRSFHRCVPYVHYHNLFRPMRPQQNFFIITAVMKQLGYEAVMKFPVCDESLLLKWMLAVNVEKVTKISRICSDHFTKDSFCETWPGMTRKRLKSGAIPLPPHPVNNQPSDLCSFEPSFQRSVDDCGPLAEYPNPLSSQVNNVDGDNNALELKCSEDERTCSTQTEEKWYTALDEPSLTGSNAQLQQEICSLRKQLVAVKLQLRYFQQLHTNKSSADATVQTECWRPAKKIRLSAVNQQSLDEMTEFVSTGCQTTILNVSEISSLVKQSSSLVKHVPIQCNILQASYRSKGTQVKPKMVDIASSCHMNTHVGRSYDEHESSTSASSQMSQSSDTTYQPSQSDESDSEQSRFASYSSWLNVPKFIVYKDCLNQLLAHCPKCYGSCSVEWFSGGTFVSASVSCQACSYRKRWDSQPMIGSRPVGNIHLSAAIYFTGCSFSKADHLFKTMGLQFLSSAVFYDYVQQFLQPVIFTMWDSSQKALLQKLIRRPGDVVLDADMRADSPGHSAKFGSYTVMELRSNKVIHIELVQSNEVGGSVNMEKHEMIRTLRFLQDRGLHIDAIVTDRHLQIQKYLRESVPSVSHYYDVLHVAKGLNKKLEVLAKEKDCSDIRLWIHSLINHLYWSASSSMSGQEIVAKWVSVANHVQNIHHHDNWRFPVCMHGPVDQNRKWLQRCTKASEKLEMIVTNKNLVTQVAKLSPFQQTSSIEAFHSLILQFAPKMLAFCFKGMLARFPKAKKGEFSILPVKENPTYGYVERLLEVLFDSAIDNPIPFREFSDKLVQPPDLCAAYERPEKSEAER